MTTELTGLRGTNPLGLFAALGALDVATRAFSDRRVALWWSDEIDPVAHLEGIELDDLIDAVDQDRQRWIESPILNWTIGGKPMADVKLDTRADEGPSVLRRWIVHVHANGDDADTALLHALVAEGSTMGTSSECKPTHFHFTAGQQKFLAMVRELRDKVTADHLREAVVGPWTFSSPLPMLGWDTSRGDRIYALRGFNPAGEKKLGVPGAEWLGFLGLRFFPVATQVVRGRAQLVTTGCSAGWKKGTFTWPLWSSGDPQGPPGLTAPVVQSLMADEQLSQLTARQRGALGVHRVLQAPISRSAQGGYGSFGPPAEHVSTSERITAMVM